MNGKKLNILTSAISWVLVLLSIILTASVLFPNISSTQIEAVMGGGIVVGLIVGAFLLFQSRYGDKSGDVEIFEKLDRQTWRMPNLATLKTPVMSTQRKIGLLTLRGYLFVAFALVVVKIVEVAIHG